MKRERKELLLSIWYIIRLAGWYSIRLAIAYNLVLTKFILIIITHKNKNERNSKKKYRVMKTRYFYLKGWDIWGNMV